MGKLKTVADENVGELVAPFMTSNLLKKFQEIFEEKIPKHMPHTNTELRTGEWTSKCAHQEQDRLYYVYRGCACCLKSVLPQY